MDEFAAGYQSFLEHWQDSIEAALASAAHSPGSDKQVTIRRFSLSHDGGYFALGLIFAVFVAIAFGAPWALVGAGAGAVVGHAKELDNLGRLISRG